MRRYLPRRQESLQPTYPRVSRVEAIRRLYAYRQSKDSAGPYSPALL